VNTITLNTPQLRTLTRRSTRSRTTEGYVLLCVALWCVLSSVLVHRFLYSSIEVIGRSMAPTLQEGDWRLINRWRHRLLAVERGDVVVFQEPRSRLAVVKRVIGLPGDIIQFRSDAVYVNYRKLPEPYLPPRVITQSNRLGTEPLAVGPDQYFLLGDNRSVSLDSREYGAVDHSELLGIVTH